MDAFLIISFVLLGVLAAYFFVYIIPLKKSPTEHIEKHFWIYFLLFVILVLVIGSLLVA